MTRIDVRVWGAVVLAVVACGGGGTRETPDAAGVDAPGGGVLRVSPSGDNAADGFTSPVATLGKALQLAMRTREPVDIELAAGTYMLGSPDILPYNVPSNVQTIAGPAGGGAILVGQEGSDAPLTVMMRGSTLANNTGDGLRIRGHVTADFGTTASPGNNLIRGNTGVGLSVLDDTVLPQITAAGNTWNANLQGADAEGKYIIPTTIAGPIATTAGNNFALPAQANLVR